jgi:hypothetical protein
MTEQPQESATDADETSTEDDGVADEMSKESFPTSDPPSTWAGSDEPDD